MALIGNGAQAEFQALAFKAICGIDRGAALRHRPRRHREMRNAISPGCGLTVMPCKTPEEAILGAQIITTCTADKQYATILTDNMVGAGVHINAVGGDCPGKTELHRDILLRVGHLRRISAADPDRGRDPAARPRSSGDRAVAGDHRRGPGPQRRARRSRCSTASASRSRISPRCATSMTRSRETGLRPDARHDRRPRRSARPVRHAAAGRLNRAPITGHAPEAPSPAAPQCSRNSPTTLRHSPGPISLRWVKRTECSGPSIFSCQNSMNSKSFG